MSDYQNLNEHLIQSKNSWLVTGCAGFIGSNLVEALLNLNQEVVGLDNFSTGKQHNLDEVKNNLNDKKWSNFHFIEGDICSLETCRTACEGIDYVLHQAALGSVPRSIADPIKTNQNNIDGFLNMLVSAKDANIKNFVYAASSSTYGDHPALPKIEENIGRPLSPYAVTKYVNELYADVFKRSYDFDSIGLRYFNVFGQRQDPDGAYAAVIPKWVSSFIENKEININGDGETSRDFCFIENVIQANLLSAMSKKENRNQIYNVAVGGRTSLNTLFDRIKNALEENNIIYNKTPNYRDFRVGDVKHSQADISKIQKHLGYTPEFTIESGLKKSIPWYINKLSK